MYTDDKRRGEIPDNSKRKEISSFNLVFVVFFQLPSILILNDLEKRTVDISLENKIQVNVTATCLERNRFRV